LVNESVPQGSPGQIWAVGRRHTATRGGRLFGFKAHYEGPVDDAVELFFFRGCYVGVNLIEDGLTNVCGLAPEELLDPDDLVTRHAPLADRLRPLSRSMQWLTTGPLVFSGRFPSNSEVYPVGDALAFVDPFTGSGLMNAVLTGTLAGECAAADMRVADYLVRCRSLLEKPFRCAGWLRDLAGTRIAEFALPLVPGKLLFRITRSRFAA
jgi:flavin-dependent dehydrogenase